MTVKMKANQYQVIKYYILSFEYSKAIKTVRKKLKCQQKDKKFILLEGQLFHEEKKGQPILVVQKHQVVTILYMVHDHLIGKHRGSGSMS